MNCPGSVRLTAGLPDQDSVYAREGTFLHACAADALEGPVEIGRTDGEFTLTQELYANVIQPYVEYINGLLLMGDGERMVEQQVLVTNHVYGTADAIIVRWGPPTHVEVIDLKCGAGELVEAEDNPQLLIYALGAMLLVECDEHTPRQVDGVTIHIVQPRRSNIAMVSYTRDELMGFFTQVKAAEAAALAPDAPLCSGSWCRFCKAESTCPRLYEDGVGALKQVFPTGDVRVSVIPPGPADLTNEELAKVIAAAKAVRNWLDAADEEAYRRAVGGQILPGMKLVERLGNRAWRDEATAIGTLAMMGIDPYNRKVVSPAQAEKLLGRGAKQVIDPLTSRQVTGLSLVPDTDKRPAALPSSGVFTPLTDGE